MRRVLVCGSRDWGDHDLVWDALSWARYGLNGMVVVHGACPTGADAIASWWVRQRRRLNITEERHPADWAAYGKRAGFLRNAEMVQSLTPGQDLVLAFQRRGSRGTQSTIDLARAAGVEARIWRDDE